MLRRYLIGTFVFAAFFGFGFATGCSVGFDAEQPGTFECESDDDCADGFTCAKPEHDSEHKACMSAGYEAPEPCGDADGDGYGTNNVRACEACRENPGDSTACSMDCDDSNPDRYPGAVEICDGIDNDCSQEGDVDEVDEPMSCTENEDCRPLSGTHHQDGVQPVCQDGECLFRGLNYGSPDCEGDGTASCRGEDGWADIPEECIPG